jgi:ABC-type branched-subunit amino acid transport system substrate-binding protein
MIRLTGLAVSWTFIFGLWATAATTQGPLTPEESRGKQIYLRGTSASGVDILAYVGQGSLEVPGSAMACANCHGLDGLGKPEGGVSPSKVTWDSLTRPLDATGSSGRQRPAYTERELAFAITLGLDPAGNRLLSIMPRYQMSRDDLKDLLVYLKRLGNDRDPGISDEEIVIGTAIPSTGSLAEMGKEVKAVTLAFFAEINSQGGVYNRRLKLKSIETAETPAATRANIERFLKDEYVFAMTGAFIAGAEKEIVPMLAQHEVPLVGPLTLDPQIGVPLNRQVFYLGAGVDGQARALINFIAARPEFKSSAIAVVYPLNELNASILAAIKEQSQKDALKAPQAYDYVSGRFNAAEIVNQLRKTLPDVIFFMGNTADLLALMRESDKAGWFPKIFLPGTGAAAGIFGAPLGFDGRIFISFPTTPDDQTAEGIKEFRALAEKYQLTTKHQAAQISAYVAAKILVEALKRAGRDLSRERLVRVLEGLYEYPTGLTPTITFGPNRRIGAMGAYVLTIDLKRKQFVSAGGWVKIN